MHNNCMDLYRRYGAFFVHGMVLEIGPDAIPSSLQRASQNYHAWETADIASRDDLSYPGVDENKLPMERAEYETVISANVLEHVRMPWLWIKELARVLRPGGHLITIAPASYVYHAHPVDCWRVWPEGMRALYVSAGLQVVTIQQQADEKAKESVPVIDVLGVGHKPLEEP